MHDRAGRGVLYVYLPIRLKPLLNGECSQGRFMEATKDQFLFARVEIDVANSVNPGFRRLEFLRVNICLLYTSDAADE